MNCPAAVSAHRQRSTPNAFRAKPANGDRQGKHLGGADRASNKIDDLGGKAKEALGKLTHDRDIEKRGKADQAKSSLKDAGEKIKDALKKCKRVCQSGHLRSARWRVPY